MNVPSPSLCLLLLVLLVLLSLVGASAAAARPAEKDDVDSPALLATSSSSSDDHHHPPNGSSTFVCSSNLTKNDTCTDCSFWFHDDWVVAGRDFKANKALRQLHDGIVVPFTQHDRRAFPLWNRFRSFTQVPNKPYEFLFVPSVIFPLQCHDALHNLDVHVLVDEDEPSASLADARRPTTTRAIKAGDPLFLKCHHEDLSSTLNEVPDFDKVVQSGICLDGLEVATTPTTRSNDETGVFATRSFTKDEQIMFGPLLHMHRSELLLIQNANQTDDGNLQHEYEELLNYCFGHPDTSFLFLPAMPFVNAIRHAPTSCAYGSPGDSVEEGHCHDGNHHKTANVAMRNDMTEEEMEQIFDVSSPYYFERHEYSFIRVSYVALRDIHPGEELFIDNGRNWQKAWDDREMTKPFRHEKDLESSFFPQGWLRKQVRDEPFPELDLERLEPGQVSPARLTTGRQLGEYLHRVGLPQDFTAKLNQWAEDIGITRTLQDLILNGKALEKGGEMRVRINGGTWWIKRFWKKWKSDMHYITPDDDESNEQYMVALGEAGFDQVLSGIGAHFDLERLSCFYSTFIAVSHCYTSYMHSDSDFEKVWNLIFPMTQMNTTDAEINLGADWDADDYPFNVPYKYETEAGVLLGLDGMHGTAPTDYRGLGGMRLVASVYMGDFNDDFVDDYVEDWHDPPYPRRNHIKDALMLRTHWKADDPTIKVGSPQVKLSSSANDDD